MIERIDVMDENISIKFRIRMGDFMRMNGDKKVHETIDFGTKESPLIEGSRQLALDKLVVKVDKQ